MWTLKEIDYKDIEDYDNDYCRRSEDPEVPEGVSYYGVFADEHLVSYFAIQDAPNDGLFIRRGYILPQFRHKQVWDISLKLLEQAAINKGYRNLTFVSFRNPFAYAKLFKNTGFKPTSVEFTKHIGN